MSLSLSETEMSRSDHEKQCWNPKKIEVIEETDEEFYLDDMENSESENLDHDDDTKGLEPK